MSLCYISCPRLNAWAGGVSIGVTTFSPLPKGQVIKKFTSREDVARPSAPIFHIDLFLPVFIPPLPPFPSIPLLPPFPPLLPSLLPPFLLPLPPFPLSPSIHSSGLLVTLESSSRLSFIGHQGPAGLVPHSALGVANTARNFPWATSHGWLFRKHGELWMSQDGRIHNSVRQPIWRLPGSPTLLSRQAPGHPHNV